MNKIKRIGLSMMLIFLWTVSGCGSNAPEEKAETIVPQEAYTVVNDNIPIFS